MENTLTSDIRPLYRVVSCLEDIYKCFAIKAIVFVEEQRLAYADVFDSSEYLSIYFLATTGDEPAATARIRQFKDYIKIERLAVREKYRNIGIGKGMFLFALRHAESMSYEKIVIHAQTHLTKFYEGFGFVAHGEKFTEAGIEHYYMEKRK